MRTVLLCVTSLVATTLLLAPSDSGAMIGIKQDPQPPWTARVDALVGGKWAGRCSGVLVAPRTVLTAGHCLSGYDSALGRARLHRITFSVVIHGRRIAASRIGVHGDYMAQTTATKKLLNGSPDIGYLRLRIDATAFHGISPAPMASRAELESLRGERVSVSGHGGYRRDSPSMAAFARRSPDRAWSLGASCDEPPSLCFTLAPEFYKATQMMGGDSGGPWMGYTGRGWKLLGLVSGRSLRGQWVHVGAALSEPRIASWLSRFVRRDSGLPTPTRPKDRSNVCRAWCRGHP